MQCPVCDERMREIERSGVMVDICPSCKGIWLDRGELEKLIEISRGEVPANDAPATRPQDAYPREPRDHRHDDHDDHDHGHDRPHDDDRGYGHAGSHGRRRGWWLTDILEGLGGGD